MVYKYNNFYKYEEVNEHKYFICKDNNLCYLQDCLNNKEIETERLLCRDSHEEDLPGLEDVYMSCAYMQEYTGEEHKKGDVKRNLVEGDIPPGGHKEFYYAKTLKEKETHKAIGFFEYYLGFPKENTLWISSFLIHKDYQHKGYGSEFIQKFIKEINKEFLNEISIGVYKENEVAMAYWQKNGFIIDSSHKETQGIVKLDYKF